MIWCCSVKHIPLSLLKLEIDKFSCFHVYLRVTLNFVLSFSSSQTQSIKATYQFYIENKVPAYMVFSTSLPQPETSHRCLFPELVLIAVSTLPCVLPSSCSPSILYPINSKPLLRNNIMSIPCLKLCSSFLFCWK